jgi:replication factor C subunit 3/5
MRKVLNILESCSLAYKHIPLEKIYDVTGRPSPADVKKIYNSLMQENYNSASKTIVELKAEKSLALDDIIRDVHL